MLVIGNIKMWRHPKYYKELRKLRNKSDPAISDSTATANDSVRPGRGQTDQAISHSASTEANSRRATGPGQSGKQQAASDERQATSEGKRQATSGKRQASE